MAFVLFSAQTIVEKTYQCFHTDQGSKDPIKQKILNPILYQVKMQDKPQAVSDVIIALKCNQLPNNTSQDQCLDHVNTHLP